MLKRINFFAFILIHCLFLHLNAQSYPLSEIYQFADGLNIEGGTIASTYLKENQIWANLCVVLDRPFMDGIEWQELTDANCFPLKEASILSYNECQVNLAYLSILKFYMQHGHDITQKPKNETVKILIQVHRNTSGPKHLELLADLLLREKDGLKGYKDRENAIPYELFSYIFPNENIELSFCYGTVPEKLGQLHRYDTTDIVISFSLVAGFNPEWHSGTFLVPSQFIPYSLDENCLYYDQKYSVKNHLKESLPMIIALQNPIMTNRINQNFYSANPEKQHMKATALTESEFKAATLVQVNGMFNPSKLSKNLELR